EVDAPHVPRFGNAESGFKQLVLHSQALASMAECSTMPHSAWLDCRVLRSPSRVRCAGLRPPLTAPTGRSSAHPTPSDFKRGSIGRGPAARYGPPPTAGSAAPDAHRPPDHSGSPPADTVPDVPLPSVRSCSS